MAGLHAKVLDIQGAFLHGIFEKGERLYMKVPEGMEHHYKGQVVLLLLKTIYGLKQAAYQFWLMLLRAFGSMNYQRSRADPCLYFRHTNQGLVMWISWVDDCLVVGPKEMVMQAKKDMMDRFDCDDVGELKEYVGCKVTYDEDKCGI